MRERICKGSSYLESLVLIQIRITNFTVKNKQAINTLARKVITNIKHLGT